MSDLLMRYLQLAAAGLAPVARELVFLVGLVMLFIGVSGLLSTAAAQATTGALLIWLAIPPAAKRGRTHE